MKQEPVPVVPREMTQDERLKRRDGPIPVV